MKEGNKKRFNYFKMNNQKEKDSYKKKRVEKESTNNVTEDVIYGELFIVKTSNQELDRETCIADSGATSHIVNTEEKITNLEDA